MTYTASTECYMPSTVISGRLVAERLNFAPLFYEMETPAAKVLPSDVATAMRAMSEGKNISERVLDKVVDRLLEELTW